MSTQSDVQAIENVYKGLDKNQVARFSYTKVALDNDIVDGVDMFNRDAEQNIPNASKTDYNPTITDKGIRSQGASIPRMGFNHYLGRTSYNLNKAIQKTLAFLGIFRESMAHNANEYDTSAKYLKGDVCYITEVADDGTNIYTFYKRISTSPTTISGISPTVTSHWAVVLDKINEIDHASINTWIGELAANATNHKNDTDAHQLNLKADLESPALTGIPTVPAKTTAAANNGTLIATEAQVALKANLASPVFTGTPTVPTPSVAQSSIAAALNVVNLKLLTDLVWPVGVSMEIGPNDATPTERGLPGTWADWTQRAEVYGLATVSGSAYRLYSSSLTNVTAGEYLRYEDSTTGEFKVIRAKAAMATLPAAFDPISWWFPEDGSTNYGRTLIYVRARATPSFSWGNSDKTFNSTLTGNSSTMPGTSSTTYYVHEKITWAGKFPSFDGGNRPPFVSGGSHGDRIRDIKGNSGAENGYRATMSGVFYESAATVINQLGNTVTHAQLSFDASRVVRTGTDNSPLTLSCKLWRRVS